MAAIHPTRSFARLGALTSLRPGAFAALVCVLALGWSVGGCASDDAKSGDSPGDDATWEAGAYTLTAHSVDDKCLDGAADAVAIPDNTSREFTNPLMFPGSADETYKSQLALVAPFSAAEVTFTKTGTNTWDWAEPVTNIGVDLGELNDAWADCKADFEFQGSWKAETVDGQLRFAGTAAFVVTGATGDGCPVLNTPPCAVTLEMIATRK